MRLTVLLGLIGTLLTLITGGCFDAAEPSQTKMNVSVSEVSANAEIKPESLPAIRLVKAFANSTFKKPVALVFQPGKGNWIHIVEQAGKIYRIKNDDQSSVKELVLDLTKKAPQRRRNNEEGLLALRFHPKFKDNGHAFVYYSMHKGNGKPRRGVISRFEFKDNVFDIDSEKIILEVTQPYGNHDGCEILFGTDGYLYASFGDGGAANDPHKNGQNKNTLLASIIRIDVDKEEDGRAYAVPKDNPFVDDKKARGEIWAYGLRNVWRMNFDLKTGLLWAGDVGQNAWEEVDIVVKGGNYGWNKREGSHAFMGGEKADKMIEPVAEYARDKGISVVGGFVYRGKKYPLLQGVYLYADFYTGRVWGLKYDAENKKVLRNELLGHFSGINISSFAADADNELYVVNHRGNIQRVMVVKED